MSAPWLFQKNCDANIYMNVGVAAPPAVPPTYGPIDCQLLRPETRLFGTAAFFASRFIFKIADCQIFTSTDMFNGMQVQLIDSGAKSSQWYVVNDVSMFAYFDASVPNFPFVFEMLLCRRAAF